MVSATFADVGWGEGAAESDPEDTFQAYLESFMGG
jgi:hypothetical protein